MKQPGTHTQKRFHLDTDFGGDPDDACALVMLLGCPDITLTGITTDLEHDRKRALGVAYYLKVAEREDIPVAAGADKVLSNDERYTSTWDDKRGWPELGTKLAEPGNDALGLLEQSIRQGAAIIAIGALTNLALLETAQPGILKGVPIVIMGGWLNPPAAGYPQWGPEIDFNIQCDTKAAEIVFGAQARITLVTLPAAIEAHLTARHLEALETCGPLGRLLALQSNLHAAESQMKELAAANPSLPDDLINFHWDPVTCAVALGWEGAPTREAKITIQTRQNVLYMSEDASGTPMRVVTKVDGDAFAGYWLNAIKHAHTPGAL